MIPDQNQQQRVCSGSVRDERLQTRERERDRSGSTAGETCRESQHRKHDVHPTMLHFIILNSMSGSRIHIKHCSNLVLHNSRRLHAYEWDLCDWQCLSNIYFFTSNVFYVFVKIYAKKHVDAKYTLLGFYFYFEVSCVNQSCIYLIKKTRNCKILLEFKNTIFYVIYIYVCDAQLYFQHHYSSIQCHMIFRNHNNMLIYDQETFLIISMLKTVKLANIIFNIVNILLKKSI